MNYTAKMLGASESTEPFKLEGECDLWVLDLSSGAVELHVLFPGETEYKPVPLGVFTESVIKTVYVAEHGVLAKLVGVGNNTGVYARLAKPVRR